MEYILKGNKSDDCVFCNKSKEECSEENLVIYKGTHSFVIMNKFPYNSGHLLVMPYEHKASLEDLSDVERIDLINLLTFATVKVKKLMHPEGMNIGLNLGRPAGAGVDGHLHFHIVPRWNGDTNFMTVFEDVRVVPEHMKKTYKSLFRAFNENL